MLGLKVYLVRLCIELRFMRQVSNFAFINYTTRSHLVPNHTVLQSLKKYIKALLHGRYK